MKGFEMFEQLWLHLLLQTVNAVQTPAVIRKYVMYKVEHFEISKETHFLHHFTFWDSLQLLLRDAQMKRKIVAKNDGKLSASYHRATNVTPPANFN